MAKRSAHAKVRCDSLVISRKAFVRHVEDDDTPDSSFMDAPGFEEDKAAWESGAWICVGVYATVELPDGTTARSFGLWNIFVGGGYGDPYLDDVYREECADLERQLKDRGIVVTD